MASFSLPTRQGGLRDRNESRFVVFREACPWSVGSVQVKLAAGTFGGADQDGSQRYTVIPAFQALLDVLNK